MKDKPERIDFKYNLKIYFEMLSKYKVLFLVLLGIVLIIEASNVADRFLFKIIIDKGTEYGAKTLSSDMLMQALAIVAIIYISVILVRTIGKWMMYKYLNKLEVDLITDTKMRFFNHLIGLSHKFHTSNRTGSMISRLSRGGRAIERMTDLLIFNLAPLVFQLTIVSISILTFDVTSGIIVFATVAVFIGYSYIMQEPQKP